MARLFTVADYHKMAEVGILDEDDRVELIEGEILNMTPIGPRHAGCVAHLTELFGEGLGRQVVIWTQNPIRLGEHSEPQPDLALLRRRPDFYTSAHPRPEDVLLVIEVVDTSLPYDQDVKVPLYSRSGIPEVWLVDLNRERLIVYCEPGPEGYRRVSEVKGTATLSPQAFPELILTVDQVLGRLA